MVYLSRVQNNENVDFFYAFRDTGSALSMQWSVPAGYSTSSEFAVGTDCVYMWAPGNVIERRSTSNGALLHTSLPIPADFSAPRMAVDGFGRLFFSNGAFSNGRFYAFDPDLTERWSISVPNINIGAPAIGAGGTLVVAGVGGNVFALRSTPINPCGTSDFDGDGDFGTDADIEAFFACLAGNCCASCYPGGSDFNGDGDFGTDADIESFFRVLAGGNC
jgi:hypothetical protein